MLNEDGRMVDKFVGTVALLGLADREGRRNSWDTKVR